MPHSKKTITDNVMIAALIDRLERCDGDELAMYAGYMLGGECSSDGEDFEFTPNENYTGIFE